MTRVLVTCVGSGVGQSIVDSLNLSRNYYIVGCDGNPNVYAHSFCDKFYSVKGIYDTDYIEDIIDKALKENIDIIVPGHDYELYLFSNNIDKFKKHNLEVLVSEPEIIKVSRNKRDWYDYFNSKGCSIVPTFTLKKYLEKPDESIFPAIVKPVGGSASQGIYIVNYLEEVLKVKDNVDDLIIQPYLFPEKSDSNYNKITNMVKKGKFLQMSEISIQLIFDKEATFQNIFISKNVLKNGVPVEVDPINPKEFKYTDEILKFVPVLEEKGVKGPVNIQGRVTDKGIYFFEMNQRFTGITGNRALFGFNEVAYLVDNFLGKPSELKGYSLDKIGVRQVACATIPKVNTIRPNNTIIILGGGSNIGQYFIKKVAKSYQKINLITRSSSVDKYKELYKEYSNIDIVDADKVYIDNYFTESDSLINFVSALANTSEKEMYQAILFVQSLMPRIVKAKLPRIINISSQSVYDQQLDFEKTEKTEVSIVKSYGFQKVMIEEMFASVNHYNPQTKVVSLRLARVLNPIDSKQCGFFRKIVTDYSNGNSIHIDKPLNKTNLIHIEDVVNAIEFMLKEVDSFEKSEIVNVGGENITMKEFCKEVENTISNEKSSFSYGDQLKIEISSTVSTEFINEKGWMNTKTVKNIIEELI